MLLRLRANARFVRLDLSGVGDLSDHDAPNRLADRRREACAIVECTPRPHHGDQATPSPARPAPAAAATGPHGLEARFLDELSLRVRAGSSRGAPIVAPLGLALRRPVGLGALAGVATERAPSLAVGAR